MASPIEGVPAGFKVHYGKSPKKYTRVINVGMVTSYTITGLAPGTYYFAVTAYDSSGNQSPFSNVARKKIT